MGRRGAAVITQKIFDFNDVIQNFRFQAPGNVFQALDTIRHDIHPIRIQMPHVFGELDDFRFNSSRQSF